MSRSDLTDAAIDKLLFATPDDMIGEVIDFGGMKGRLTKIVGSGADSIVFEVTDVQTGTADTVAKFPRSSFEPRFALSREGKTAMEQRDWEKLVRLCDRFLLRIPDSEEAAFNKGTGHMARGEFEKAAAAFDLAVSLKPSDLLNWIFKASAAANLGRSDDLLAALVMCEEINAAGFREFMTPRHEMLDEMKIGLEAIPRKHPHHRRAQKVLKSLFGKRGFWG